MGKSGVGLMRLDILSAGAAQEIVSLLSRPFKEQTGIEVQGQYGAVGAIKEKLVAGEPADVIILTSALIASLLEDGYVVAGASKDVGMVRAAIAVRNGDSLPSVNDDAGLGAALSQATAIYLPDPERATAGIHFARVIDSLGLTGECKDKLRAFPNGHAAMTGLAQDTGNAPIGSTQVTEILTVPGVSLAGFFPKQFELSTIYTAAVAAKARSPVAARAFVELLTGDSTGQDRTNCGFE